VCTATYRFLPTINLPDDRLDPAASEELVNTCPLNVFDIEEGAAVVANPRNCTSCRECLRNKDWQVALGKQTDFFIFTVESTGVLPARTLFQMALEVLREKCTKLNETMDHNIEARY
jgi:DNA-directed RNA polymerase I and III subunit RPAC1